MGNSHPRNAHRSLKPSSLLGGFAFGGAANAKLARGCAVILKRSRPRCAGQLVLEKHLGLLRRKKPTFSTPWQMAASILLQLQQDASSDWSFAPMDVCALNPVTWAVVVSEASASKIAYWSLASLQTELIKVYARVICHARAITFKLIEVAVCRDQFTRIIAAI